MQIYPVRIVFLPSNQKKCVFFVKIKKKVLVFRKKVVSLPSDSGMNPRPGPVPGKETDNEHD